MQILSAVAELVTALSTMALAWIAWFQIDSIRKESKQWETVKIFHQYDTDPILFECAKSIRVLSKGADYGRITLDPVMQEVRNILNYFDSLAVGVTQGVYIEEIIRDNLEPVICLAVDNFVTDSFAGKDVVANLNNLTAMRNRWKPPEPQAQSYFRDGTRTGTRSDHS